MDVLAAMRPQGPFAGSFFLLVSCRLLCVLEKRDENILDSGAAQKGCGPEAYQGPHILLRDASAFSLQKLEKTPSGSIRPGNGIDVCARPAVVKLVLNRVALFRSTTMNNNYF